MTDNGFRWKWIEAVRSSEVLSATAKFVAFALSFHMNKHGEDCRVGLNRLASETSLARSTVWDALRELHSDHKFLAKFREQGRRRPYTYRPLIPESTGHRTTESADSRTTGEYRQPDHSDEEVRQANARGPTGEPESADSRTRDSKRQIETAKATRPPSLDGDAAPPGPRTHNAELVADIETQGYEGSWERHKERIQKARIEGRTERPLADEGPPDSGAIHRAVMGIGTSPNAEQSHADIEAKQARAHELRAEALRGKNAEPDDDDGRMGRG